MAARWNLWSRDETVLALELAMAALGPIDAGDQAVGDLSRLLRGRCLDPRHRNPHGVACKVRRLAAMTDGHLLPGGTAMERRIFDEFAGRPVALAQAAAAARAALTAEAVAQPSRGPAPAFGDFAGVRTDGRTFVYLARLFGAALPDGRLLAKVGRSVDVARRMDELNGGFPAPLGLRWSPVATWRYRDGGSAHVAEQAMLARLAEAGCSMGGEFLATDAGGLGEIAAAGPGLSGRSFRTPRPSAPASRDRRRGRSRRRARPGD